MLFQRIKTKKTTSFLNPDDILRQAEIKEGEIVAELGCGSGHFVFEAARAVGSSGLVYAIDVQKSALSEIRSKIKLFGQRNVKPILADLEKIGSTKIPQDSVDLAVLSSTLHQAKNKANMLLEAKRMLKKRGRFLILDWRKEAAPFGPPKNLRVDEGLLKAALAKLGFKFLKNIETDQYHFCLLVEK